MAALLLAPLAASAPATAAEAEAASAKRRPAVIEIRGAQRSRIVDANLLGINHRYPRNGYGLWNAAEDRPVPTVVERIRRAGVESLRYPGGTTATMYHWKDAIGPVSGRKCQIEGHGNPTEGFGAVRTGLAYGPDEFMEVIDATGAKPLIMMPFVTQNPSDAADWVEYMNAKVGTNPSGGISWAQRRAANGHRAPYGIHRWEVGNESHVAPIRYGFSPSPAKALQQYTNGGVRSIEGEPLGKRCGHPAGGVASDGKANQVFEVLFTPARVRSVTVAGARWTEIDNINNAGQGAKRYDVLGATGRIAFGDGRHGRIPVQGAVVRASYVNTYSGFFDFARRMHQVDKSIEVCATWGTPQFPDAAGKRNYNCMSAHPITNFTKKPVHVWNDKLEGHDRMMLGLSERRLSVEAILRQLPDRIPLLLTEFQPIHGFGKVYPGWAASLSNAVYMASQWQTWLRLGIRWGNGGDLLGRGVGSVFGSFRKLKYSVEAVTRQAISPMFRAGGRIVDVDVRRNPVRRPNLRDAGGYVGLSVVASRARGDLWVFVVNRLPSKSVKAAVRMNAFTARGTAGIRRVAARSYTATNRVDELARVGLQTGDRRVGRHSFRAKFPPHSVTVFRIPQRG